MSFHEPQSHQPQGRPHEQPHGQVSGDAAANRPADLHQGVVNSLIALLKLMRRAKNELVTTSFGLSSAHRMLLLDLARMQGETGCRLADLADDTRLDPSTVSREIGQLVKLGYVERGADAQDGRVARLMITAGGAAAVDRYRSTLATVLQRSLSDWDEQYLQTFADLLVHFVAGLDDALSAEILAEALPPPASAPSPSAPSTSAPSVCVADPAPAPPSSAVA